MLKLTTLDFTISMIVHIVIVIILFNRDYRSFLSIAQPYIREEIKSQEEMAQSMVKRVAVPSSSKKRK